MGLVNNHKLGTLEEKVLSASGRLDKVGGNNGEALSVEDRHAYRQVPLQALNSAAQDELSLNMKFLGQFPLPLLGQVRRAQHGQTADLAAIQQFAGDDRRFDGLADANVVGDQETHRIKLERHHQRHKLIRPWLDSDTTEAAKRASGGTGGQSRGFAQQLARRKIPETVAGGQLERSGLDRLDSRQDAGYLLVETTHRPRYQQIIRRLGLYHPVATSRVDEGAGIGKGRGAHVRGTPKMSGWRRTISLHSSLWWKRITM